MMKRMFCLLLTVLMGVSCIFASAEDAQDNSADALTLAELQAFAARMQTLAMASTAPAAPSIWPVMLLVELTTIFRARSSPRAFLMARVSVLSFMGVEVPWAFT